MDEQDKLVKRSDLAGAMLAHAENAHDTVGNLSRAELRTDPARVQKVTAEIQSLCKAAAEFARLGWHVISLDALLEEAGLPPARKISAESLQFKKLYQFVRNSLPALLERLQDVEEVTQQALSRLEDPDEPADEDSYDDELGGDEKGIETDWDGDAAVTAALKPPDVPVVVRDYAVPETGAPEYGSVLEDGRHVARPFFMGRLDPRLQERGLWEELAQQSGRPLDPGLQLVFEALACEDEEQRIELIETALAASPNCVDAQVLYAEEWSDFLKDQLPLFQKAVETAERLLGPEIFKSKRGQFWSDLVTRPYMRARAGLANCLRFSSGPEAALGHWEALLELNPADHQGLREDLLVANVDCDRLSDAEKLHERYRADRSAFWRWSRANLDFRASGNSEQARASVQAAVATNPFVKTYLTAPRDRPFMLPDYYALGTPEEAIHYFEQASHLWRQCPGALSWLKRQK